MDSLLCTFIDSLILKLKEAPEMIPTGEISRSYTLYCDS
jgi:DNA replicative helicase MCM subunit Mcm2 (Cdc46/Mcm family)